MALPQRKKKGPISEGHSRKGASSRRKEKEKEEEVNVSPEKTM